MTPKKAAAESPVARLTFTAPVHLVLPFDPFFTGRLLQRLQQTPGNIVILADRGQKWEEADWQNKLRRHAPLAALRNRTHFIIADFRYPGLGLRESTLKNLLPQLHSIHNLIPVSSDALRSPHALPLLSLLADAREEENRELRHFYLHEAQDEVAEKYRALWPKTGFFTREPPEDLADFLFPEMPLKGEKSGRMHLTPAEEIFRFWQTGQNETSESRVRLIQKKKNGASAFWRAWSEHLLRHHLQKNVPGS